MVPHVFGWFTMTSVWFILFTQLEHARRDIHEVSDRNIPEWVFAAIIGTSLIFMSFALVQIIFQRLAPGFYWGAPRAPNPEPEPARVCAPARLTNVPASLTGTEIAFCILSLTAKMYLGWFLLINVIYVDGSADETLRATNNEVR